ncbi:MAG: undecaprenyldiphospho-muramoylpentapeptide beta-N-acetylglucosaminyltransferase [Chitinophagales bacterium]|nr:undecaprenyldiphospho-muramoylpentapeptide beta-N-acetylglucosaminyltransferase [Chitinophagales bacterium]
MRVVISGGGTGGHVFPALAIAQALQQNYPGIDLLFVGAEGRLEMRVVPEAGFRIIGLPISGLQRRWDWRNLLLPWRVLVSVVKAWRLLRQYRPQVVAGVGGYASLPVLAAAAVAGIPSVIQEQNSYAGLTNRLLGRWAKKICVAYEGMERFFPAHKLVITGNPVRRELTEPMNPAEARASLGLLPDKPVALIVGGSLGAATLNQSLAAGIDRLLASGIQVMWQTGANYYEKYKHFEKLNTKTVRVQAFIRDMRAAYAAADVVVSRAGALAIAELCLTGKAAILVPSPHVAEDHQRRNAEALVEQQAALMIADADALSQLVDTLLHLMADEPLRHRLSQRIATLARPFADKAIAQEIWNLVVTSNQTAS